MSQIYDIANDYVERYAALNPLSATSIGVPGFDDKMSDFSPQGADANADLNRRTIAALNAASVEGERDRIARDAMLDDLQTSLDTHDAGEHLRSLRVLGSPFQGIRMIFDLMPRETEEDWRNIAARMSLVPEGLASYRQSLVEGARQSKTSSRRQASECAKQARVWSGAETARPRSSTGCWTPTTLPGWSRTRCAGTLQPVRTLPPAHMPIWGASSRTST